MNWEQIRAQLETILEHSVELTQLPLTSLETDDTTVRFVLEHKDNGEAVVLRIEGGELTSIEHALIDMMIRGAQKQVAETSTLPVRTQEQVQSEMQMWVLEQLNHGNVLMELPDKFVEAFQLHENRIPLLLMLDSTTKNVSYRSFKKLLESFFSNEILLMPLLEKEWLILASEDLLTSKAAEQSEVAVTLEEELSDIGSGLHEMLEAEWGLECSLGIAYPCVPRPQLLTTICKLRETLTVGRTFNGVNRVHMAWQLRFETLLFQLSDDVRSAFLEDVFKGNENVLDSETVSTLEQFFMMDCNVSETAKKLYIHRNTLLYRLDKFKQEVGLDVRTFHDAVLVKMCMALYKVYKLNNGKR
ncbi:helix-turn-helix domain-containing protein [Paenibacillus sp. N1-5-1-14]|uniref:PucR family transcriptional regulator n=1 Tax=Paenibacillus radicibacter TaxID=2972488 RepID=UPI00215914CE|nr:helix-turn-helix domain-containing protein [Paenibacillus radicibacter]MCR8643323.1 helix-turn-helix domain-containing protein [Paenibacillus radicibacter]